MSSNEYLLVFDTNILYVPYKDKADFTIFNFNSTFKNILDKIEELELYENIKIGVPVIVWEEMKKQKNEAYKNKIIDFQQKNTKFKFPFCRLVEDENESCYEEFLDNQISIYKVHLNQRLVKTIDLFLPSSKRFKSIVNRALEKRPPFEGANSTSDKGFKDALIWESILEYKSKNKQVNMLLYSDDKLFCPELMEEFREIFKGDDIKIFNKTEEDKIMKELEKIAIGIDKYIYITDTSDETDHLKSWLYSIEFTQLVIAFQPHLNIVNKYIKLKTVSPENIYDIVKIDTEKEEVESFQINLEMKFLLSVLDNKEIEELHDSTVIISIIDGVKIEIDSIVIEEGD